MSIASWLQQTVHVASVTTVDSYGKNTLSTPRAVKARVEGTRRMVRRATGDEAMATHVVYLLEEVRLTDRLWLPGKNPTLPSESNVPLAVHSTPDKSGGRVLWKVEL